MKEKIKITKAFLKSATYPKVATQVITGTFTILVTLSLAEFFSAYPTTGGLYFWVSRLATADWVPLACWVTGWCNWIGVTRLVYVEIGISSIDLGLSQFIAGVVLVWDPEGKPLSIYAQYIVFVVFANMLGIAFIVIVGLALTKPLASGDFVFTRFYNGSGFGSNRFAFLLVILQSQYTLRNQNSQSGSPFGILVSVAANAISGFVFLVAISFMVINFDRQMLSENAMQPQMIQVFYDDVGPTWSMVFLVFVVISIFFCGSALLLGSSRMVYAFARDGAMPFSKQLHLLNNRTQSPINAVWMNVLVAGIVVILHIINSTAYKAIVSVDTIGSQMSYLVPIFLRITTSRTKFVTEAPITADNMNYAIVPFAAIMICSVTYFYFWVRKWFTDPVRVIGNQQAILEYESIRSSSSEANKE
ncbi:amino acid/polyamine transporter I [Helicostylum pulchrum]|nr:amino acid/polyamine transporter I [Helicostylum pulchrum]